MSRVVVFGSNGRAGRAIVEESLRAGHDVTAAVRDPQRLSVDAGRAPVVVRADVRDAGSVLAATAGQDAVVCAIGPAGRTAGALYSTGARTIVDAMVDNRVDRLVALSSSGVRRGDPHHPLWYRAVARTVLRELYADMRRMEEIIAASPLDWTVVRPARILDEPATGHLRVGDGANPEAGTGVALGDLARFVVQEVDTPRWSRAYPTLAR